MMKPAITFPGSVFDADVKCVTPNGVILTQAMLDAVPVKSLVSDEELPLDGNGFTVGAGRLWLLDEGSRFDAIPAAERYTARAILRAGMGILLLAPDRQTEKEIRQGLVALMAVGAPGAGCGHA